MFKYVHFLIHNEIKNNVPLVSLILNRKNGLSPEDHCFVTAWTKVFEAIKDYDNTFYIEVEKSKMVTKMIEEYSKKGEYLFLHSLPSPRVAGFIPERYWNRIIWRTWGHDMINNKVCQIYSKNDLNRAKEAVKCFKLIGLANIVDKISIEENYGNINTGYCNYPFPDQDFLLQISRNKCTGKKVLIGHSGYKDENHINCLELIKKFLQENIDIYLVLAYGDEAYVEEIEQYVDKMNNDKIHIIKDFKPIQEYARFINSMDISIIDGYGSKALGTFSMLTLYEKKIFINSMGVVAKGFMREGIPFCDISDIKDMDYLKFIEPVCYNKKGNESIVYHNYEYYIRQWKDFIRILD